MVGLVGLAALGFRAQERDVKGYQEASQESIHWSAAQVEVELARFISALSSFSMGDAEVTQEHVTERFDILWSRTGLFRGGSVGERLAAYDEDLGVIPILLARLQAHEEAVLKLDRRNFAANMELIRDFIDIQERARRLSVKVLSGEEMRFGVVRDRLREAGGLNIFVSAAAIVLATVLVIVMLIETRQYERSMDEIAELADKANAANKAKSRFLTMMSHELRTPMNGVLGSIALVKQSGLSTNQNRLLDQAERSASEMTGLLSDILDFSDLQTERLEIDHTTIDTRALGESIIAQLEPSARRRATMLHLVYSSDLPQWVVGDFARIRQVATHLSLYLIEIVNAQSLTLAMSHQDERLTCSIRVQVGSSEGPGWQPEAIFGRDAEAYGDFASDSVGPTIARGLVALMGGEIVLDRIGQTEVALNVVVPSEQVITERDSVRVVASSATGEMVLRAALGNLGIRVWQRGDDPLRVMAVLIEASAKQLDESLSELRAEHIGARLIGSGVRYGSADLDGHISMPPDPAALGALLSAQPEEAARAST
jgi:signal transduction histidine kinase